DQRLRLLNSALLEDGVRLQVAGAASGAVTLHLVHVSSGGGAYPRVVLDLGPGAHLRLFEYHVNAGAADSVAVPVADLELGEGAVLEHYSLGLGNARAIRLEDVTVEVARDAVYRHRHIALGGYLARLDLRIALAAPGASADLAGLFIAREQR